MNSTDRSPATFEDFALVEDIPATIGKSVHVEGLWRGCRWTLLGVDGATAYLRAQKSGDDLYVHVSRLLHTRRPHD